MNAYGHLPGIRYACGHLPGIRCASCWPNHDDQFAHPVRYSPTIPALSAPTQRFLDMKAGKELFDKWEAIRQTVNCPTCNGTNEVESPATNAGRAFVGDVCPDCTDGKIDMARLLAVGAAVFNDPLAREAIPHLLYRTREWRPR